MKTKLIIPALMAVAVIGTTAFAATASAFAESGSTRPTESQEQALSTAVADGKLTEAQKVSLQAKLSVMRETKDAMKQSRDEIKAWAEENNLELKDILPAAHRDGRGHHAEHKSE